MQPRLYQAIFLGLLIAIPAQADVDRLIADFEQDTYENWTVEGKAFGPGPAKGALPNQMEVTGFKGERLVNSFYGGDSSTGKLISPKFRIDRSYLTFLIGGGGFELRTCINLKVDGQVVRSAVGPNTTPGGSEQLLPHFWNVDDLRGRNAVLEIVDTATGSWGHINLDQIVLTDQKPAFRNSTEFLERTLVLDKRYLLFPIQTGARSCVVDLRVGGKNIREFDAELAADAESVSFWSFLDVTEFNGKEVTLRIKGTSEDALELIYQDDEIPGSESFYNESLRPQFHFSQVIGWNNDPNGMVYYDGEWHLFFQHNPYGWKWGNMHWGHAVSPDLVHWEQLPIAIYNTERGDYAFSGSAVVDQGNTGGWQTGDEKVIVAAWTSTGRGECIAYSNDRGRSFTEFEGNPVVTHGGRDPKLVWYEPGNHWVMAVYDESSEDGQSIAFYKSNDLRSWELTSKLPGFFECPELVELPIDGDKDKTRWVLFGADARYVVGNFDGSTFTPDHEGKYQVHYGSYYASQIFNNAPDGRKIQIGWARIAMPGMPFNQTFTLPHDLSLRSTPDGIRMFAEPVNELGSLVTDTRASSIPISLDQRGFEINVPSGLLDMQVDIELGNSSAVILEIGADRIRYDAKEQSLDGVSLAPVDNGVIRVRVLVDRPMLEIVGNNGRIYITKSRNQSKPVSAVRVLAEGGSAILRSFKVSELESIWNK